MRPLLLAAAVALVAYFTGLASSPVAFAQLAWSGLRKAAVLVHGLTAWDGPQPPHARLLSAARNATTDQESLALLIGHFLQSKSPELEDEFVSFLQREAARSRVGLERALDALLAVYRFLAPFLVAFAVVRLAKGPSQASAAPGAPPPSVPGAKIHQQAGKGDPEIEEGEATHRGRLPLEALRRLFREIDTNQDGQISKRELLLALRRDSSLAELLGLPAKVSQSRADGSYEAFEAAFSLIDKDCDDAVSWVEFNDLFRRRQREIAAAAAVGGAGPELEAHGGYRTTAAGGAPTTHASGGGKRRRGGAAAASPPEE